MGLTDATVARTPVTRSNLERRIAHDRWPTQKYIKERGVNVNIFAPTSSAAAALARADYAVNFGPDLWMPFDTVNAQWATARFAGRDLRARQNFFDQSNLPATAFMSANYNYVGERIIAHFENGFDGWQPWQVRPSATSTSICKLQAGQAADLATAPTPAS